MFKLIRNIRNYEDPMSDYSMYHNVGISIALASLPFHIVLLYTLLFNNVSVMLVMFMILEFIFVLLLWSMIPKKQAYAIYAIVTAVIIFNLYSRMGGR